MIVYFFKKSKDSIRKAGIISGLFFGVLYIFYVIYMKGNTASTVQIVRQGDRVSSKEGQILNEPLVLKVDPSILFVASKRGVYYYPIKCSKAQGLSVKNMLYFKDKMSAEDAGYKPHSECF